MATDNDIRAAGLSLAQTLDSRDMRCAEAFQLLLDLVKDTVGVLRARGLDIPVVVGGIIPEADALALKQMGIRRVYTPKDYKITQIMGDVVKVVEETLTAAE